MSDVTRQFVIGLPEAPNARNLAAEYILYEAPNGQCVTVGPPKKSREQEKKYHAMVRDIARQWRYIDRDWTDEDMKRLLVSGFREDTKDDPVFAELWREFGDWTLAPGLRGEFVVVGAQTKEFPKPLASAFIEWLYALGAEHSVKWSEKVLNWPEPVRRVAA